MPKRSNQFQRIVTYIAEQLVPRGATVKESVEIPERGVEGVTREVDTLIEVSVGLTHLRIAVESRERSRKDDIQWIDGLIGKYRLLGINQVVAVSKTGFSAAAKGKAALHNIELMSPEEALDADWVSKFHKLGLATFSGHLDMVHIEFKTSPPLMGSLSQDVKVVCADSDRSLTKGTLRDYIETVRPLVLKRLNDHLKKNLLTIYKTLDDLSKSAQIDWTDNNPGLTLVVENTPYTVEALTFRVMVCAERTIERVAHERLGRDALLSSSRVGDLNLVVAQMASAPQARLFVEPAKKRKVRRAK